MPQLDLMSFSTQIFWVIVCLSILYCCLLKYILPEILFTQRVRETLLQYLEEEDEFLEKAPTYNLNNYNQALKQIEVSYSIQNNLIKEKAADRKSVV